MHPMNKCIPCPEQIRGNNLRLPLVVASHATLLRVTREDAIVKKCPYFYLRFGNEAFRRYRALEREILVSSGDFPREPRIERRWLPVAIHRNRKALRVRVRVINDSSRDPPRNAKITRNRDGERWGGEGASNIDTRKKTKLNANSANCFAEPRDKTRLVY